MAGAPPFLPILPGGAAMPLRRAGGGNDPELERFWRATGSLSKVTFFDKGNGWASIEKVETKTGEDAREFVKWLWEEALEHADNREQYPEMLAAAGRYSQKNGNCHCAAKARE